VVSVGGSDNAVVVWRVAIPETQLEVLGTVTKDIRTALDYAQQLAVMGSAPNNLRVTLIGAQIPASRLTVMGAGNVVVVLKCGDDSFATVAAHGSPVNQTQVPPRGGHAERVVLKWEETFEFRDAVDPFARVVLVVKHEDEDGIESELLGFAEVELRILLESQGQVETQWLALYDRTGARTGARLKVGLQWHRSNGI
jgi:hypothetical protein